MDKRVVVYVYGLNFYRGLKASHWKKYYWLDLTSFFSKFLKSYQVLQGINYFSCIPWQKEKEIRQRQFFQANLLDPRFKLYLGTLQKTNRFCRQCHVQSPLYVEKESDVRLSSTMIIDVVENRCDISILVSGDRDFLPTIQTIHDLKPSHKIFVFFPPNRTSFLLKGVCTSFVNLAKREQEFTTSLLPLEIRTETSIIKKPLNWC